MDLSRGALATGVPLTSALLRLDPMFDPLRNDPRFQKLAEEPRSQNSNCAILRYALQIALVRLT
jgi:hypothetical protein